MSPAILGFLCGCLWFVLYLIAQLATFQLYGGVKRSAVLLRGILGATVGATVTVGFLPISGSASILLAEVYAIMAVGCLFVLYGPFFYTIHASLSVETSVLLLMKGGRLALGELRDRFVSKRLFEARLLTMVESGYLNQNGTAFSATPRGRKVARIFGALKSLWHLGPGG